MTKETEAPQELTETALEDATGGVAMLLPAVSKAREAARSTSASMDVETMKLKTRLSER
ncbi:MAG: hypothetical protein AAGC81_00460 [Pseudomonadota bacterium]